MASREMKDLIPKFRAPVKTLLEQCRAQGVEMRPSQTLRDPFEQAKLWRQSRSKEEIRAKIKQFRAAGADFLAFCLENVGPQSGDPVTNAPPGLSWHQWGEAVDCFWVVDGQAEWSTTKKINGVNGYQLYAAEAKKLGLTAGGLWAKLKDWPHVQLQAAGSPLSLFSLADISATMKERFENHA